MNTFKRKSLYAAVLAGLGAMGVAGSASAVHVNPDGLGEVLIYPYYTVRTAATAAASGQYNTYVSVTNTTASYKAVKVRFLEGKNSREVLDFNLFLSPYDVWTGSVEPTTDGAKLVSTDKSCTFGVIPTGGQPFSNLAYSGLNKDNETASMDRTREGYVEIIEMGEVPANMPVADDPITHIGSLRTAMLHVNGVAPCTGSVMTASDTAGLAFLTPPTGGLMGSGSLLNPSTGVDYTYDAVALMNWSSAAVGSRSTSLFPTLGSGVGAGSNMSDIFAGNQVMNATWAATLRQSANGLATSAALMRNHVLNEFVLDAETASATDWVVTFPTKKLFVFVDPLAVATDPSSRMNTTSDDPFYHNFGLGGSCDNVGLQITSREEQRPSSVGGFSPTSSPTPQLCWEANVITFNQTTSPLSSAILGSTNVNNISTNYANGWLDLSFTQLWNVLTPTASRTNGVVDVVTNSTYGLPVVGFMVQDFVNGNLTVNGASVMSSYGGNFAHKYTRDIRP